MVIEKKVASEIVKRLSETIEQDIIITDTAGKIIAGTVKECIGNIHKGSVRLLEEELNELIVESDDLYEGTHAGIYFPVTIEGETVGSIGIAGDISRVYKFGQIIRHMTEILLMESRVREQKIISQKARDRFYEEWVEGSLEQRNPSDFFRLSKVYSIDVKKPYRILVISLGGDRDSSDDTLSEVSGHIRAVIKRELSGNAFRTATRMVCIIPGENFSKAGPVMKEIKEYIEATYSCPIIIGSDSEASVLHLNDNYEKATLAMERALTVSNPPVITYYDDFDLNYLFKTIDPRTKRNFFDKLFTGIPEKERAEALSFASVYLEENGSITAISERLFVHRNTIKYRITKLTDMTGVDIRTCHGAYVFTVACNL